MAHYSLSLLCAVRPTPPSYYGRVALQGPPKQTLVWKPQASPTACLSAKGKKKGKERTKRTRERPCRRLHRPGAISRECRQTMTRKRKTWAERTKNKEEAREERRNSQLAKCILAQGVRYKLPVHRMVPLPNTETKTTCRQHAGFQTHRHRGLSTTL